MMTWMTRRRTLFLPRVMLRLVACLLPCLPPCLAIVALLAWGPAGHAQSSSSRPSPADDETASPAQARAQAERSSAEIAVTAAREQLGASYETLESLVVDLRDDYALLTSSPQAATHRNALVVAMSDSLDAARARLTAMAAQGRRPSRKARARVLAEVFADPVAGSTTVDPRLAAWIAARVADDLGGRGNLDDVGSAEVLRSVAQLFVADESWYVFWNRSFHVDLPEAALFAAARTGYEEAGLALDRLRRPERYGPRGEIAPPGMVVVPGGNYELGPGAGYKRSLQTVSLRPFALDRREVTQREFKTFIDAQEPSVRKELLPRDWILDAQRLANHPPERANHPVIYVSWDQAAAYAAWIGKRLPTENEWEAAAAGTTGRAYPWGDRWSDDRCNGAGAAEDTLPVESFPQATSGAGCFDMAGNAWEWTATLEDESDVSVLPDGPVNVIIRGGSFRDERDRLTCRYRWIAPGHSTFAHPLYDRPIGFRCAADL